MGGTQDLVVIRTAIGRDGLALADLDRRAWIPGTAVVPTPPPGTPFFDEHTRPDEVLVAEADGAVVGWVRPVVATRLASNAHVFEIRGVAVDPEHQGRGIGRRLVQAAEGEARRRGARKMSLRVLAMNIVARRLYESCGYAVEGVLVREFLIDGELVDDVLMSRWLG